MGTKGRRVEKDQLSLLLQIAAYRCQLDVCGGTRGYSYDDHFFLTG
jgi:hypothetical protein